MALPTIYLYETRKLAFLKYFFESAQKNNFKVEVLGDEALKEDDLFKSFCDVYRHNSDNPYNFELQCFARYFALLKLIKTDTPFIIADSDIILTSHATEAFKNISELSFAGNFIGSEGFTAAGSEKQISPHFSVWNITLLKSFVEYLIYAYRKNSETNYLHNEYLQRKTIFSSTGISDMTMLYAWLTETNVRFINSNLIKSSLGIDHNISALYAGDDKYISYFGRKRIYTIKNNYYLQSVEGERQQLSLIHFQGGYKAAMRCFYKQQNMLFKLKSLYIFAGRKAKTTFFK